MMLIRMEDLTEEVEVAGTLVEMTSVMLAKATTKKINLIGGNA